MVRGLAMLNKKALAGAPSTPPVFVEDVFSTYLYTGNTPSTNTIVNGIDLATKGGMVWTKTRSSANSNTVWDTARGVKNLLITNQTAANLNIPVVYPSFPDYGLQSFNTTGFTLGKDWEGENQNGVTECSWTFRKQTKFFDIVTYTGNGTAGRAISHSLGSTPGCVIVKATDLTQKWTVFHRSLGGTKALALNLTDASDTDISYWNNSNPTSTTFIVGGDGGSTNNNGTNYVAYIFAHDAGGFGTAGTDNVISCGSFTTDGGGNATVNLGYEPQFLITKVTNAEGYSWRLLDTMRGWSQSSNDSFLTPNSTAAESNDAFGTPTATGFQYGPSGANTTHIYIAIRRGPMKTPTSGTSVFETKLHTGTGANATLTGGSFPPDLFLSANRDTIRNRSAHDRLRGIGLLVLNLTNSEDTGYTNSLTSFNMTGISVGADTSAQTINNSGKTYAHYYFGRAPGFMDVVCYTGNGSTQTITHNLGVVPELIIGKNRTSASNWPVLFNFASTTMSYAFLNQTGAGGNDTYANVGVFSASPTSTSMFLINSGSMNSSGAGQVAYLFATVAGVSKVGSYTGTGTTQTINCGFTAGARFVMIKRTDSTGDWYVWDTARGIVSGNDPYLLLNDTAAEVTNTDYIDPVNSGFELSSTAPAAINANGGSFIFMAIA